MAILWAGHIWEFFRKEWFLEEMRFRCDNCQSLDVAREAKEWKWPEAQQRAPAPAHLVRRL